MTTPRRLHISGRFRLGLAPLGCHSLFSTSLRATFSRAGVGTYAFVPECPPEQLLVLAHQSEVDLASIQVHTADLHTHARADGIANASALTTQLLSGLVELEVFATQLRDVYQAFDVHRVQGHENAEAGGCADHAAVFLTQMLAHVLAFEPGFHVTAGLIGAALIGTAVQACSLPRLDFPAWGFDVFFRFGSWGSNAPRQPFGQLGMGLARGGQHGQLVPGVAQNGLDHPVHQQVWVAANRAGEVGVGLKCQAEMAAVDGRVNGLLHRPQQHGVNLLRVRPLFGRLGNGLEFRGLGVVADRHAHRHGLEIPAQDFLLLRRGALVYTEQAGLPALLNEVRAADVGRQHRLFDQLVRIVARAGHDLLDTAIFITHDLGFGGFKIHRTTLLARHLQRAVHVVQVEQIFHAILALAGLRATRVRQDGCHLGVCEPRVAVHHGGIELVRVHLPLGRDQHVAHHAQSLHLGVERAQAIAQLLGQHGNHPAWEVHTGGTVIGINIDGTAGFHVVAHIGNRHQQAPALASPHLGRFAIHCIVKVARIFSVNGDERHIGQINAVLLVDSPDFFW